MFICLLAYFFKYILFICFFFFFIYLFVLCMIIFDILKGFNVFIGPIYRDIDEIEDLIFIYELFGSNSQIQPQSQLESPSSSSPNSDLLLSDEQNTPLYTFPSRTINYYSTIHSNIISQIV